MGNLYYAHEIPAKKREKGSTRPYTFEEACEAYELRALKEKNAAADDEDYEDLSDTCSVRYKSYDAVQCGLYSREDNDESIHGVALNGFVISGQYGPNTVSFKTLCRWEAVWADGKPAFKILQKELFQEEPDGKDCVRAEG